MKVKVVKALKCNWYKVGDIYELKDTERYGSIGVQVILPNNYTTPDVIAHGDYEYLE